MSVGYYLIHDTCPDLYDKTIKRLVKQLKADKTPYTIAEINTKATHGQACNQIGEIKTHRQGCNRVDCSDSCMWNIHKRKICRTCLHQPDVWGNKGRNTSDKLTIINIQEDS